jgi:diguanylate cyclase (GGDEF)-like protein/PAS domain S-box-containing protein
MSAWRDPFTGHRLRARFRWATVLLLLPLLGLAGVSGAGLVVGADALAQLDRAQQLTNQMSGLDEDVQFFGLSALDVLIGHGLDDLTAMSTAEQQVDADFATLARTPGLTRPEVNAVLPLKSAWSTMLALRGSIRALGVSSTSETSAAASALEDSLSTDIKSLVDRVSAAEAVGNANVVGLRQQRDASLRASAITVVIALVLGLAIAMWLSNKLAQSVLRPLSKLMQATKRLAAGDLRHRVAIGSGDEIAELGEAFDTMAGQLEHERDAVRARERRLSAMVENASDGILVLRRDGTIDFATPSFQVYLDGHGAPDARLTDIVHTDDLERVSAAWGQALSGSDGSTLEVEGRLAHRDGSWHHVRAKLTNRFEDPAVAGMVLNISDITERHEHERELNFQALHDTLTGLPNRKLFRHRLEDAGSALENGAGRVKSVLFLDIDDFKTINDTMGHQAGDDFLVAIGQRLLAAVRPEDTVARLGGDEYAVLLDGSDSAAAVSAVQQVLTALEQPLTLEGKEVAPRASVGIASATAGAGSPETLLADADLAMYFAKRKGKAQYQVFSSEMRSDLLDRLQLGEDLRAAVESGDIQVHYQPIVDVQTSSVVGAEALARWHHPTRGWVGPTEFIALAEELNLVERIDACVLRQACTQGRAWADAGLPRLRLAVNLSGSNLNTPDLVANVARTLDETGFAPANLELELTEGVVIAESAAVVQTLENLKALGLHLAIDDFGTGYSALSRLRVLPFDTLKVDKVFVDELTDSNQASTLAESILDMARVLGLKVVAEGVETSVQADFLRRHGCDFAQGYLFSRPLEPSAFAALVFHGGSVRQDAVAVA